MTEKITCPVCGSNKNVINTAVRYCCLDCDCLWNESKRKPPVITPEMAWEWFCERMFESDASIEKIFISFTGIVRKKYVDCDDVTPCILGAEYTRSLGWQDMPERTRE